MHVNQLGCPDDVRLAGAIALAGNGRGVQGTAFDGVKRYQVPLGRRHTPANRGGTPMRQRPLRGSVARTTAAVLLAVGWVLSVAVTTGWHASASTYDPPCGYLSPQDAESVSGQQASWTLEVTLAGCPAGVANAWNGSVTWTIQQLSTPSYGPTEWSVTTAQTTPGCDCFSLTQRLLCNDPDCTTSPTQGGGSDTYEITAWVAGYSWIPGYYLDGGTATVYEGPPPKAGWSGYQPNSAAAMSAPAVPLPQPDASCPESVGCPAPPPSDDCSLSITAPTGVFDQHGQVLASANGSVHCLGASEAILQTQIAGRTNNTGFQTNWSNKLCMPDSTGVINCSVASPIYTYQPGPDECAAYDHWGVVSVSWTDAATGGTYSAQLGDQVQGLGVQHNKGEYFYEMWDGYEYCST